MAAAKHKRSQDQGLVIDKIPECPVCLDPLAPPIYQCETGHDICGSCSKKLHNSACPICRKPMTHSRNQGLEKVIMEAMVSCPNKDAGCVYTKPSKHIADHLKECIFRQYRCPVAVAELDCCSWMGQRGDMMSHFSERHGKLIISLDTDIDISYSMLCHNNGHLHLTSIDRLLFLINLKIDNANRLMYMTVQHIGTKTIARQYNYKIEITYKPDPRRIVIFNDTCENDTTTVDEIINQGKCGVISLDALQNFVAHKLLSLRFSIEKQYNPNKRLDKNDIKDGNDDNNSGGSGSRSHSKGPGPRHAEFKGHKANRGRGARGGGPMKNTA